MGSTAESAARKAADSVQSSAITEVLDFLVASDSPNGAEAELAERFAVWGAARFPQFEWRTDRFDGRRANLIAEAGRGEGPGHGIYAHLDTSLTGDVIRDAPITGRSDVPEPFTVDDGMIAGHGIAVAKGSVAAALIAAAAAAASLREAGLDHRLSYLLAAGGTHRLVESPDGAVGFGVGIRRALRRGWRPATVLNVKAGAPAPLLEEPGAAYISVKISGSWDPVLFRDSDPGTLAALGPLLLAVETTRRWLREISLPAGSIVGRELGMGAVRAGALDKPDLLPGLVEANVFAVLAPGDRAEKVREMLHRRLLEQLGDAGLGHLQVETRVVVEEPGAVSPPDVHFEAVVHAEWSRYLGDPPVVADWRGSTDSVVMRAEGIPTIRCGPPVDRDLNDLRRDVVGVDVLTTFARLWAAVIVHEASRTAGAENPSARRT